MLVPAPTRPGALSLPHSSELLRLRRAGRMVFSNTSPLSPWGLPASDQLVLNNQSSAGEVRKHVEWLPTLVEQPPLHRSEPPPQEVVVKGVLKPSTSQKLLQEMRALAEGTLPDRSPIDGELLALMRSTVRWHARARARWPHAHSTAPLLRLRISALSGVRERTSYQSQRLSRRVRWGLLLVGLRKGGHRIFT